MKTKLYLLTIFVLCSFGVQAKIITNKSLQSILNNFEVYKSPYSQQSLFYLTDRNFEQLEAEFLNKLGSSWTANTATKSNEIPSLILTNSKDPKQQLWLGYKEEVTPQGKGMFSISIINK